MARERLLKGKLIAFKNVPAATDKDGNVTEWYCHVQTEGEAEAVKGDYAFYDNDVDDAKDLDDKYKQHVWLGHEGAMQPKELAPK